MEYNQGQAARGKITFASALNEYLRGVSVARIAINRKLALFLGSINGDVLDIGGDSDLQPLIPSGKHIILNIVRSAQNNITADARTLPFRTDSLAGILCISVLEHCTEPEAILNEITRCLRGRAFISVPWLFESHMEPHDYWRFSQHLMEKWFEKRQLIIEELSSANGYFGLLAHFFQKRRVTLLFPGAVMFFLDWLRHQPNTFRWTTQLDCLVRKARAPDQEPSDEIAWPKILQCPVCIKQGRGELDWFEAEVKCSSCHTRYPISRNGGVCFLPG